MPSRWVCVVILLFWTGFNGWFFYQDLLPRLLPGQPPSYTIDLVEEARTGRPAIDWTVFLENERVFRAKTEVRNPAHDVFELVAEFAPASTKELPSLHGISIRRLVSLYRVNQTGDLLGLEVEVEGSPKFAEMLKILSTDFTLNIEGETRSGWLVPHLSFRLKDLVREKDLPPVRVPSGVSVLLPLHPVNRLQGIKPGQTWTLCWFDPLADSLGAIQGKDPELQSLLARVRPQLETFSWNRRQEVECLVIDYKGDRIQATTRVAKDTGLVLSQEAVIDNQRWTMNRD